MELEAIESEIKDALGDCSIEMQADENRLMLLVVSDAFEGLNRVKRQQLVYALLKDRISSGEVHAVNMKTLTRAEASAQGDSNP